MAKIYFHTVGCRLNQAEAERMAQGFILSGHEVVRDARLADIRVVNTCTVTGEAERKSRRAARANVPGQKIVVTGCHSQVRPLEFSGADLVVRNEDKEKLVRLTRERFGMDGVALGMDFSPEGRLPLYPLILDHTRAFVKIQDGCNMRCSFCLTTIARGASRSRTAGEIVKEIQCLADKGCCEVVLTGVHAGSYGDGATDLGRLIERVLSETSIPRVRLSSLEPWNFKYSWLDLWSRFEERFCRHLHMSLQSGCDAVLRRMRRGYDADTYAEKIAALQKAIPEIAITTDIIVGFPGETDTEHQTSLAFVKALNLAGAHVFTFSPRPGTDAAQMSEQVARETKSERFREMKELTQSAGNRFREAAVGADFFVLWERPEPCGAISGLTDTYLRVQASDQQVAPNTISKTRIIGMGKDHLQGEPIKAEIGVYE